MKFIRLKIKNIASIEEAEIHFNEGVLANAPRFLICGDMGAGKSTLLDSICLALYNNTPRLSQAPDNKLNYGSDNITAQDPRNLLRHGSTEGSVELDFEGSDGKLYSAAWCTGRKSTNNLRDVTQTLTCGHETITNKKQIENRIKTSAVGLNFQQFCRTTLLAQGQFTQFLKSKDNEKSEILEKLTQTDIYSLVGKEIALLRSEYDKKFSSLEAEIKGAQLLSDEEIAQLNVDISSYEERLSQLKLQKEKLEAKSQWLQRVNEAQTSCENADKHFQNLKNITENIDFQKEEVLIRDWNNSSEGRLLLQEQVNLEKQLNVLKTEQVERGKQAFETAQRGLNHFTFTIEEKKKSLSDLKKQLEQESIHSSMYEQSQTLVMQLKRVEDRGRKIKELRGKIEELQTKLPTLEKNVSSLISKQNEINTQRKQNSKNDQDLQEKLRLLQPQQLEKQRDDIDKQLQHLQEVRYNCTVLQQTQKNFSDINSQIEQNKKQQRDEEDKIKENRKLANERKKNWEEALMTLEKTKLALGDEAARLRAQLHIGDTCPICGNTIQQFRETESLQNILKPQQDNVNRAKEAWDDTETHIKASEKIIQKNQEDLPTLEKKYSDLHEACTAAEKKARENCQKLNLTLTIPDDTLTAIGKREEKLKTEKENIRVKMQEMSEIRDAMLRNREDYEAIIAQEKQIAIDLEEAKQLVQSCKDNIKNNNNVSQEEEDNRRAEFDGVRGKITWTDWEKNWESDPAGFLRHLQEAAQKYANGCNQAVEQRHAIELDEQRQQDAADARNTILQQWPDWECNSTAQQLVPNTIDQWKTLVQKANQLHVKIEEMEKWGKENRAKLEAFIGLHPELTVERLEELMQLTESQLPILQHQQIEKELQTANGALKQAEKKLAEVKEEPHPSIDSDETLELLLEQVKEVEKNESQWRIALGEAKGQLKQNEQIDQVVAGKKQNLEKLRHTLEQWKKLSGMFGTKDGVAFRNVAQSFLLQNLVRGANEYLKELTQRYRLDCIPGTLTLSLRDMYQGEMVSPVDTLSGGESFLVSLSLALALSAINRKSFSIDILFIDEGFGNLSSNELETVLNMLARLQKMNGKRVGIISHVDAVKEHIPVHVEVKRIDPTRSRIEVVDVTKPIRSVH